MRLLNSVWAGEDVLCDRGPLSTLVYQGLVDGVDLDWLRELNGVAMEGVTVTSTIVLCASFETMVERLKERDAFDPDLQDLDRLRGIWEVYESLKPSKVYPFSYPMGGLLQKWADLTGPIHFVNAEQSAEDVCKDVLSLI
jgi:thymidylate kinase